MMQNESEMYKTRDQHKLMYCTTIQDIIAYTSELWQIQSKNAENRFLKKDSMQFKTFKNPFLKPKGKRHQRKRDSLKEEVEPRGLNEDTRGVIFA